LETQIILKSNVSLSY